METKNTKRSKIKLIDLVACSAAGGSIISGVGLFFSKNDPQLFFDLSGNFFGFLIIFIYSVKIKLKK